MNLGDPELELIDPTPDVHSLFVHFDKLFFWGMLESKTTVRWSKRMYSCAGICSYQCRGGQYCDIALSEPLLKLRPRKDLIETLLHEMIHALLFVSNSINDRDGHGPAFQSHMRRINLKAGLNITIYHNFHDEVNLYLTHVWRCDGPCHLKPPHYGIIRRTRNSAPGPREYWWFDHLRHCGGKFIKIKEPAKEPAKEQKSKGKQNTTTKPNADITKYIITSSNGSMKPVLKDSGNITATTKTQPKSAGVYTIGIKGVIMAPKPQPKSAGVYTIGIKGVIMAPKPPPKPIPVFTGTGHVLGGKRHSIASTEMKTINEPTKKVDSSLKKPIKTQEVGILKDPVNRVGPSSSLKHKTEATDSTESPPAKTRKIDDYFNSTTILKDLYGDDYKLKLPDTGKKLVAVKIDMVDCPVCSGKFNDEEINRHLDECLNKDIIKKLTNDGVNTVQETQPSHRETVINTANTSELKEIVGEIPPIPAFQLKAIPERNNNEINSKILVTGGKTDIVNGGLDMDLITPVVAFNPFPSLLKNTNDDIIDLTSYDFNTSSNINTVNTDKGRRNTASEATLSSQSLIEKVPVSSLQAGSSKVEDVDQRCPICRDIFDKPIEEHLDECPNFFKKHNDTPDASTVSINVTLVIEDDDDEILDESQTMNATGTKTLCPCCFKMVEHDDMNDHLDECLMN